MFASPALACSVWGLLATGAGYGPLLAASGVALEAASSAEAARAAELARRMEQELAEPGLMASRRPRSYSIAQVLWLADMVASTAANGPLPAVPVYHSWHWYVRPAIALEASDHARAAPVVGATLAALVASPMAPAPLLAASALGPEMTPGLSRTGAVLVSPLPLDPPRPDPPRTAAPVVSCSDPPLARQLVLACLVVGLLSWLGLRWHGRARRRSRY